MGSRRLGSRSWAVVAVLALADGCAPGGRIAPGRPGGPPAVPSATRAPTDRELTVADVTTALSVAARLAVRLATGPAPPARDLADVATPALAAALAGTGKARATDAVVRAETVDDLGPDRVGAVVAVEVGGRVRVLDELAVRTPTGWRVAEVEL